ncbi:MAG: metallophosphoesterase [Candidatus Aenigmarchaeota archaeon]|nr:metallophosphoesterase [Candidatus Aenigmarchaeota archaeon]
MFVPGNHETQESADAIAKHYNVKNLDGDYIRIDDVGFFGAGGANMMLNYVSDKDLYDNLKKGYEKIKDAKKKIMVTHVPPAGTAFEKFFVPGSGSKAITRAIEKFQPDIHICGHIHEMEGFEEKIGKTRVISVGSRGRIIDI